jgi:uncharacterized protein
MDRRFHVGAIFLLLLSTVDQAAAQGQNGFMNIFNAMMGAAIVNNARAEWSRVPASQTECIEERLQQRGLSIGSLIQNGIVPNDPRIAGIRFDCRTAGVSPSMVSPGGNPAELSNPEAIDVSRLAETPTFDCTPARSLTARTVCADRAGASADWDLITAYWARYFSTAENEREAFDKAQQDWLDSLNRKCPRAPNPPQCVLAAYHSRAAVYRSQLAGDALAEARLSPEQHGKIQQSLLAKGLLTGNPDGEFGSVTRSAIRQFKARTSAPESDFLTVTERSELLGDAPGPPAVPPASPPSSPPPPRIETARLKDARIFLEDAKKFIGQQTNVPTISEIAKEAASLQLAVNQFDEHAAVESMRKLGDLLKPVTGFTEFEKEQQVDRAHTEARQLAEAKTLAGQNIFFIESYFQGHLGEPTTQPLLRLRQDVDNAVNANTFEKIAKANDAVSAYVKSNGLQTAYDESARKFTSDSSRPSNPPIAFGNSFNDKSKFLIEGAPKDILLLYNASPEAPKVWKNVRGDVVFQDDAAALCFAQPSIELPVAKYVEHYLGERGAKSLTSSAPPCGLTAAAKTTDIIAFRRGDLLKSKEDYVLALAKLLEADTFRRYETITSYGEQQQKDLTLSLEIESDLEKGTRKGFGALAVTETPVACIIANSLKDSSDGMKELLQRNSDSIAPALNSGWNIVDTPSTDLAFRGLQRHQCGYLLADDESLKTMMLALRREQIKYTFAPVWWDSKVVAQAAFDANDAKQQEILRKKDFERKKKEQDALEDLREKNKQNQKTEIERKLREQNGTKARGLMNYIQDLVSGMAFNRSVKNASLFPVYDDWLKGRFIDRWETFNVTSDVADFGAIQWHGRPLDAIVVKTIVQQKNRILGKYEERCYLFGFINDDEFDMLRDSFSIDCDDASDFKEWKTGGQFHSRWNAD